VIRSGDSLYPTVSARIARPRPISYYRGVPTPPESSDWRNARRESRSHDGAATLGALAAPAAARAALALICAVGLGLVIAAPWAEHRGSWIAPFLYAIFDPVCHQIPERSFHLWHQPLAVCHRCTGLYLGFALGAALWPSFPRAAARLLARPRSIVLFSLPLVIDALLLASTPASRFLTGVVAAAPVALLALAAAAQIARSVRWARPFDRSRAAARGAT
jgi:uncharacterized membrane protein